MLKHHFPIENESSSENSNIITIVFQTHVFLEASSKALGFFNMYCGASSALGGDTCLLSENEGGDAWAAWLGLFPSETMHDVQLFRASI